MSGTKRSTGEGGKGTPFDERSEKGELNKACGLMLALAGALATLSATPPDKYHPPAALSRRLSRYLGADGLAVLLLRDVRTGVKWHDEAKLHDKKHEGDPLPLPTRAVEYPLLPARRWTALKEQDSRRIKELREWWCKARVGSVPSSQINGVVGQGEAHYWVRGKSSYVRAATNFYGRISQFRGISNPGYARSRSDERPSGVVVAWRAYYPSSLPRRIAIDMETGEGGLCLGTLLIEAGVQDAAPKALFEAAIATAWEVARVAVRQYWILWDKVHGPAFLRAINKFAPAPDVGASVDLTCDYHQIFQRVSGNVSALLRTLGHAFQTPSVALLVPDTSGNIGLVGQIGYKEPGVPFRFPPEYEGMTHLFCLTIDPVTTSKEAFQLATQREIKAAYRDFGIRGFNDNARESEPRSDTDKRLLQKLYDIELSVDKERCPRVLKGPWVYAHVPLDKSFWNERLSSVGSTSLSMKDKYHLEPDEKVRPAGVLKLQGRIPSELDRAGARPRFAPKELRSLHLWAGTISLVFHRLIRSYERGMTRDFVYEAASSIATDEMTDVSRGLLKRLDAAAVVVLDRSAPIGVLAQAWHERFAEDNEVQQLILDQLRGGELRDEHRDKVTRPALELSVGFIYYRKEERLNCVLAQISTSNDLAILGVPPELPAEVRPERTEDWTNERRRNFPRFVNSAISSLCLLLRIRLSANANDVTPSPITHQADSQVSQGLPLRGPWDDISKILKANRSDPDVKAAHKELVQWLASAKATWDTKKGCAQNLGVSESTIDRVLTLFDAHADSWRRLPAASRFNEGSDDAAQKLKTILARLQGIFQKSRETSSSDG